MKKFNEQNTEGFSGEQLGRLNHAYAMLAKYNPQIDAASLSDAILNSWVAESNDHLLPVGNDFYSLTGRAARRLGIPLA